MPSFCAKKRLFWHSIPGFTALCILGTLAGIPALAQSLPAPTSISPDMTAGTTVTHHGSVYTISGGAYTGNATAQNLFQSFNTFNLNTGDTAYWTGPNPSSVVNVINRVTGGSSSTLAGSFKSDFTNANFYFINPAGVIITNGFSFNVPLGFYVSTADALRFSDGTQLLAASSNGSTFSAAAPESFGFLSDKSGDILVSGLAQNAINFVGQTGVFGISASNLEIDNSSLFIVSSALNATAVGSTPVYLPVISSTNQSHLGGEISINRSTITSVSPGTTDAGSLWFSGGDVSIDGSAISSIASASGRGADIVISGGQVSLSGNSSVATSTNGLGNGGNITVQASGGLISANNSAIYTVSTNSDFTKATGLAGNIKLSSSDQIQLADTDIYSTGDVNSNGPGSIDLEAVGHLLIDSQTNDTKAIQINSLSIRPLVGSPAGITIRAGSLETEGLVDRPDEAISPPGRPGIKYFVSGAQNGGLIDIEVSGDAAINRADIFTQVDGVSGVQGGDLVINAGNLSLNSANIASVLLENAIGNAGSVSIGTSGDFNIDNFSVISAAARGSGKGGNIDLTIGGNGTVAGISRIENGIGQDATGAGTIHIMDTNGTFTIEGRDNASQASVVSSSTINAVAGGQLIFDVAHLSLLNGGVIAATTDTSSGGGGNITINAGTLVADGAETGVSASALLSGTGSAGTININAHQVALTNGAGITTDTANGKGGDISIAAASFRADGVGSGISSSVFPSGNGSAGIVSILSNQLSLTNGASIGTNSASVSSAGDILITSDNIVIDGLGSGISSVNTSLNGGAAGSITITTDPMTLSNGGVITTNAASGPAGNITLKFPNAGLLFLEGRTAPGAITTSSGSNTGGRISIESPYAIIMNGGRIEALGPAYKAYVTITANQLVKSSDRPNQLAVQGQLVLDSQVQDVSKGTDELKVNFADAFGVLVSHCAATRGSGQVSGLTIGAIRGPYKPISAAAGCN